MKPLLLDAFSCAGLGADGYADHFEVVCLDNDENALKHNPHHVVHGDAMRLLNDPGFMGQFDAIHASPPCQGFSATRQLALAQGKGNGKRTVDLLTPVIDLFDGLGTPYVIENVERSPLRTMPGVVRLCGSSFGLKVQRHRLFLSNVDLGPSPACDHSSFEPDPVTGKPRPWGVYYAKGDNIPSGGRTCLSVEHGMECMGVARLVPWKYLCEGLPPVYTSWLGARLAAHLEREVAA
jgi:DNA (cytosine-5)-methyltransferase 1